MIARLTLLAAGLIAFASPAQATDLNYDYVEVGYSHVDFDDFGPDLKSVIIGGSVLVSPDLYFFGRYLDGETDRFAGGRIAATNFTLGAGYRLPITRQTDLNFAGAFERARVRGRGAFTGSDTDNGYSLSAGVRHLVAPEFELRGDVTYIDIDGDDTVLTLGGQWHVSELVAVGFDYFLGSDAEGFEGRVRFKF